MIKLGVGMSRLKSILFVLFVIGIITAVIQMIEILVGGIIMVFLVIQ